MSIEKVRAFFAQKGREGNILEFDLSSATVELAAQAVGCEANRIAKTLSFAVDGGCVLIVCAGDAKVNSSAFKSRFLTKAKMLTPDEVLTFTGHAVGGVCPFGIENPAVATYLDESLRRFETVFPAAGSDHSAIELTCEELERYSSNFQQWVDVCKGWEPVS